MKRHLLIALVGLLLLSPSTVQAQSGPDDLLKMMPPGVNTVVSIDVDRIKASDIATKEKWFDSHASQYESGLGMLPADTKSIFLGAHMDFDTLEPDWTSGFVAFDKTTDLAQINQKLNGNSDTVGGKDILVSPNDAYLFQAPNNLIGVFAPAKRQVFATWLNNMSSSTADSAYLTGQVATMSDRAFLLSMDLTNVVNPQAVLQRAKDSTELSSKSIDPEQFANLLGSLKGVTLAVNVTTQLDAIATVDFGQDAGLLAPVATQLLIEFMDQHGAHVDELSQWRANVVDSQIVLTGPLSKKTMRRLISLFETPKANMVSSTAASDNKPDDDVATLTKQYYDSVNSLLAELQNEIGVGGHNTWQYQRWMKQYADQIASLPMDHVDEDMLNYGTFVSQALQDVSQKISATRQSTDVKNADLMAYGTGAPKNRARRTGYGYYGYGWGYGWYGGLGNAEALQSDKNRRQRAQTAAEYRAIQTKARASATDYAMQAIASISDKDREVSRTMSQRYPGTF